jgi:hypothetical protein
MIFRTLEHYNGDYLQNSDLQNSDLQNDISICFICYEIKTTYEIETKQLNLLKDYIKKCNCNGWVHNQCLNKWYELCNKCPICRTFVYKNKTINTYILEHKNNIYILFNTYFFRNINRITKFCSIVLFLYYIFQLYLSVLNSNYNKNYDNLYDIYKHDIYNSVRI